MEGQEWYVFWERRGPQGSVPLAQRSPPWGLHRHGRTRDVPALTLSWQGGQALSALGPGLTDAFALSPFLNIA